MCEWSYLSAGGKGVHHYREFNNNSKTDYDHCMLAILNHVDCKTSSHWGSGHPPSTSCCDMGVQAPGQLQMTLQLVLSAGPTFRLISISTAQSQDGNELGGGQGAQRGQSGSSEGKAFLYV